MNFFCSSLCKDLSDNLTETPIVLGNNISETATEQQQQHPWWRPCSAVLSWNNIVKRDITCQVTAAVPDSSKWYYIYHFIAHGWPLLPLKSYRYISRGNNGHLLHTSVLENAFCNGISLTTIRVQWIQWKLKLISSRIINNMKRPKTLPSELSSRTGLS